MKAPIIIRYSYATIHSQAEIARMKVDAAELEARLRAAGHDAFVIVEHETVGIDVHTRPYCVGTYQVTDDTSVRTNGVSTSADSRGSCEV